jgi:hypothetical protein
MNAINMDAARAGWIGFINTTYFDIAVKAGLMPPTRAMVGRKGQTLRPSLSRISLASRRNQTAYNAIVDRLLPRRLPCLP